jgi:phage gp16-like protein
MPSRNALLAQVHIAKKDLGLPDYVYRDIVFRMGGRNCLDPSTREPSAGRMSEGALSALVAEFRALGWEGQPPRQKARPRRGCGKAPREHAPLLSKINALIVDMGLTWDYAHGIGLRMWNVERLEWLTREQLNAVLVALIKKAETRVKKEAQA